MEREMSVLIGALLFAAPFIAGFGWMVHKEGLVLTLKVWGTLAGIVVGMASWMFAVLFLIVGADPS